jgi:translocation and assembly module TamB
MRRALGAAARALGTSLVFVLAVVGGLLLHLNLPTVRRAVVSRINPVLAPVLQGRIVIDRAGAMGTRCVRDVDAHVVDPSGQTVLRATGVSGCIATADLLHSLAGGPDVIVALSGVSVATVDVSLDTDDSGALRLARAFTPPPSSPNEPPSAGGRGARLSIAHATLGHATVHGLPRGGPYLDADVDGVEASVSVVPGHVTVEVPHAAIVARNLLVGASAQGTVLGRLDVPSSNGIDFAAHATWEGTIGGIPETIELTYDGGEVVTSVDLPATAPASIGTVWAGCPFTGPAFAHAEVAGTLPTLYVTVRAGVGAGSLWIAGPVTVGEELRANLHLDLASIDAHALAESAPVTDLSASGSALLIRTPEGLLRTVVSLQTAAGKALGLPVPPVKLAGQLDRTTGPAPVLTASAVAEVREPGLPAKATVRLAPKGSSYQLAFDATGDVPRLDGIPRLGPIAKGHGQVTTQGTFDLGTGHLDATAVASLDGFAAGPARLRSARLTAHGVGPAASPVIDAELTGSGLDVGPLRFESMRTEVHGPMAGAVVKVSLQGQEAALFARANVGVQGGVSVRDLLVKVERDGESASATASGVRLSAREMGIDDLKVEGLGTPLEATVRSTPGVLALHARSSGIDLVRVSRLAGISGLGGHVALDVDASLRRSGARGRLLLDLTQGRVGEWHDANAHVDATLDERTVSGHVTAGLGDVGSIDLRAASVQVGAGGPAVLSAWRTAWGEVDLSGHVDLAKLSARLPKGTLPGSKLAGSVDIQGRVERDDAADNTPDVDVKAHTTGLAVQGAIIPWRIDGLGVSVRTVVDGHTGLTSLDVQLSDAHGTLVTLAASSDAVPYAEVFSADEPLLEPLRRMPFQATLTIPSRDVATLPALLGMAGTHGVLEATLGWSGSAEQPKIDVSATLGGARADGGVMVLPLDVALSGRYDGAHGDVALQARTRGEQVLDSTIGFDARAHDLIRGGDPEWKAAARATLSSFPLQSLSVLDDRQVRGRLSGTASIDGFHEDASAVVALQLEDLRVGDLACKPSHMDVSVDGHTLDAVARIDEQDGTAELHAKAGSHWGRALAPSIDPGQPADVTLTAQNFRAAVLLPFMGTLFNELDGRLDGNVRLQIDPVARTFKPQGTLALKNGVVEIGAMGNELHDVAAKMTLTPDGIIRLDNVSARGLTGRVMAAATARFEGTAFAGARGVVQVPQREPLPLAVDGVPVGLFDGRIDVAVDPMSGGGVDANLTIPTMRLQLPEDATHDVQALGDLPGVRIGVVSKAGDFTAVALDGSDEPEPSQARAPTRITVNLGSAVQVRQGSSLDVRLEGSPTVLIGDTVRATGQLRLRGTKNVEGKTFTIDSGTVTFVDDPTNPQVLLTASWPAPNGSMIYADFVGPLKTGEVTLRSEPSQSRSCILNLMLLGVCESAGAAANASGNADLNAASGVAGAAATGPVNRAIDRVLNGMGLGGSFGLAANIDTSQVGATPRPEVEVKIARDLSVQIARVIGLPPPGANPDLTLFMLGWHFSPRWTLQTTVGDAGTTIFDLLWRRGY